MKGVREFRKAFRFYLVHLKQPMLFDLLHRPCVHITPSGRTFVHVFRESVEYPCCRCGIKELHRAAKNLLEEIVMKLRGGTQSSLAKYK